MTPSYCPECGDNKWTGRGFVPHKPMCSRRPKARPQSREEQDHERDVLSEVERPFRRYVRWPEGPSALSDMVKQRPSWSRKPKP